MSDSTRNQNERGEPRIREVFLRSHGEMVLIEVCATGSLTVLTGRWPGPWSDVVQLSSDEVRVLRMLLADMDALMHAGTP